LKTRPLADALPSLTWGHSRNGPLTFGWALSQRRQSIQVGYRYLR